MAQVQALPGAEKTVLVIDDSPSVCLAIERMLQPHGFRMQMTGSGRQALRTLEAQIPDLILCDMLLEDLPGVEICRRVRSTRRLHEVPVLLISGQASSEMEVQATGAGADGLLRKPFRADALLRRIEGLLRSRKRLDGPRDRQALASASRILDRLERVPGLKSWSWRQENGRGWRGKGGPDEEVIHPEVLLAALQRISSVSGQGALELLSVHSSKGEVILLGQRQGAGVLFLHFTATSHLGQAHHLARTFLRTLPLAAKKRTPQKEIY